MTGVALSPALSPARPRPAAALVALLATPALAVFVSSNLVNAGNLAFNMLVSRWMGPEMFGDLALILTVKLAVLGLLGAAQMAVSQTVAGTAAADRRATRRALARINRAAFAGLWLALPVILLLIVSARLGETAGLARPQLLQILALSLPFSAPLCLLRGVAYGAGNTGRIVLSANVEMAVRLAGACLAWQAGLGIEGVVCAIGLSILAGWAVLADLLPAGRATAPALRPVLAAVAIGAAPFAVLQLAQVLALDGEIFLAKARLSATEAGHVAALSLFQRIAFFACFALASVLLPGIVAAARTGRGAGAALAPVAALFLAVAVPFLGAIALAPETLIRLLAGPGFTAAAPALLPAGIAAVAFTLSYLVATGLAALSDRRGIWAVAAVAALQLALMAAASGAPDATVTELLTLKARCQVGLAAGLGLYALATTWRRRLAAEAGR